MKLILIFSNYDVHLRYWYHTFIGCPKKYKYPVKVLICNMGYDLTHRVQGWLLWRYYLYPSCPLAHNHRRSGILYIIYNVLRMHFIWSVLCASTFMSFSFLFFYIIFNIGFFYLGLTPLDILEQHVLPTVTKSPHKW